MDARNAQAPLCPEGDFRFWTGVGAGALALLALATVLGFGAPADLLPRLSLAAAHVTWAVLCAVAGAVGIAAVAIVRVRPAGAAADILARSLACCGVASLVQLVPIGVPALKVAFDALAFVTVAALLARAAFRMPSLDAFASCAVGAGVLGAVAAAARLVTWAATPG
jgi:hypothetical protein